MHKKKKKKKKKKKNTSNCPGYKAYKKDNQHLKRRQALYFSIIDEITENKEEEVNIMKQQFQGHTFIQRRYLHQTGNRML